MMAGEMPRQMHDIEEGISDAGILRRIEANALRHRARPHLGIGAALVARLGVRQLFFRLLGRTGMAQFVREPALLREQQGKDQHEIG